MTAESIASATIFKEIPEFYVIVTQDNAAQSLMIEELNQGFADLLGIAPEAMAGNDVRQFLAPISLEALQEIDFSEDGADFSELMSKQREMRWIMADGKVTAFPVVMTRLHATSSHARFKLSVPDERSARAKAHLDDFLKAQFESRFVADASTGLANRDTCLAFFESLQHFVQAHHLSVAFATIRIDRYEKSLSLYGKEGCHQLLRHVAQGCTRALAPEDVVAQLSDQQLALFMFNVSRESARVILNRLRWLIRSHRIAFGGKPDFSVTVSFAFNMLSEDVPSSVVDQCESTLTELPEDERNRLIELAA